jgi:hypothetical protein
VEILEELGEVSRIVSDTASPDEAAAVRAWLLDVAQAAANAAKEGGFMGFHAERVSEGEQTWSPPPRTGRVCGASCRTPGLTQPRPDCGHNPRSALLR